MTHVAPLSHSWNRAWTDLGLVPQAGDLESLIQAYSEPQRRYHTVQHLEECMAHFDAAKALAQKPGEVAIALWFHDAVYGLQSKTNERESADWSTRVLAQAGAPPTTQQRVHDLIMATRHEATPTDPDQRLLVDIDLAILGATESRFAEYDRQVREEYSWVPSFLYNRKRKEILSGFLARSEIYSTPHFRDRYESQARKNLASVTS